MASDCERLVEELAKLNMAAGDEGSRQVVRIVHVSDTHNMLDASHVAAMPAADLLIHTGDFSDDGSPAEYAAFNGVLALLAAKYRFVVVIPGNHDCRHFADDWQAMRSRLSHATHMPLHETVELLGLKIHGCPWYYGHTWDYQLRSSKCDHRATRFDDVPDGVDVLLTHGPRHRVLDEADGVEGNWSGSAHLDAVVALRRPGLHLHGHIHEQHGWSPGSPTITVNSAMKNRWGKARLENPPHLIVAQRHSSTSAWQFQVCAALSNE